MMFIAVDLPEPDRPHDRHELARVDAEIDAAERVHGSLPRSVDPGDALELNQGHGRGALRFHGVHPFSAWLPSRRR